MGDFEAGWKSTLEKFGRVYAYLERSSLCPGLKYLMTQRGATSAVVAELSKSVKVQLKGAGKNGFGSQALQVGGKIFAMLSLKRQFVVKLPRDRVDELCGIALWFRAFRVGAGSRNEGVVRTRTKAGKQLDSARQRGVPLLCGSGRFAYGSP